MIRRSQRMVLPCCATFLLMVAAAPARAQAPAPARNNALYIELLGNGGLYSINYERAVTPALRVRVGAGAWTAVSFWSSAETRIRTVPVMLQFVPGRGAHHLEAGAGILVGHRHGDLGGGSGAFVSLVGLVGYRYEPRQRRFLFRAGFTPFYGFGGQSGAYPDAGFLPSLGLSFGARF